MFSVSDLMEHVKSKVMAARSLKELERLMGDFVADLGFTHAVYYLPAWARRLDPEPIFLSTYPQTWMEHYLAREYDKVDPVITQGFRASGMIDWAMLNRAPPKVRALFAEAKENGIGSQGLVSAIRGPSQETAIFTVTSYASDRDWGRMELAMIGSMQTIGHLIHERVMTLIARRINHGSVHLTPREIECLHGHAKGFKNPQLGEKLGIRPDTVRAHLDSARQKLRAATPASAAVCAMSLGLLSSDVFWADPREFVGSRRHS